MSHFWRRKDQTKSLIFSLVLCSQFVTPPCADLYPATPVLGDFWLWYKLDQHKFAFKLIGFTDETAACKKQKCPVRQFWVASRLMQGREEGHVGSFGKLLWRAAAPPVPGWAVVRKDIIKKWEHVFFFPSPSPGGFPQTHISRVVKQWNKAKMSAWEAAATTPCQSRARTGIPAHLRFLWHQLQSTVIFILKCSSPGEHRGWSYPPWDHSLKKE